jgi:hypothetical protein
MMVMDTYHLITVFRDLGITFKEIAALGWRIEGEPEVAVTPALLVRLSMQIEGHAD